MKIDSVRELKATIPELLRASASPQTRAATALSASSARVMRAGSRLPSYALGVSVKNKEYKLAVRLQNRRLERSELVERIRKHARGEVDVRYVGRVYAAATPWYRKKQRPPMIGVSCGIVSDEFSMAGTLGGFVTKNGSSAYILSNNHVLADENRYAKGDPIIQQGSLDGGGSTSKVAKLSAFVRLRTLPQKNKVDCAIAELSSTIDFDPRTLKGLGKLAGKRDAALEPGDVVHKIGRTTGLRHGKVTAFELDGVEVEYDIGICSFDDQIEIEGSGTRAFSDAGDSGSLIVDDGLEAAALLFAGSDHGGRNGAGLTYGNPINVVLKALRVRLLF